MTALAGQRSERVVISVAGRVKPTQLLQSYFFLRDFASGSRPWGPRTLSGRAPGFVTSAGRAGRRGNPDLQRTLDF